MTGIGIVLPGYVFGSAPPISRKEELIQLSESLLTKWCEGLLRYQITKPENPSTNGAVWSPGDGALLGRCAESVYPFLWCAKRYRDERFYQAALRAVKWAFDNVAQRNGSWHNGPKQDWDGITVFIATAMAKAIYYHGDILEEKTRCFWLEKLHLSGQWLYKTIDIDYSNINYPAANTYAMALLGTILNETKFSNKASELGEQFLGMFTPNSMLLQGEGRKNKDVAGGISPKGCYPVDLGYNVEESLPALAEYGLLQNDQKVLNKVVESLRAHLQFMLPDGGWDNSWGTRNYKWTWWGSRTSDGCQPAYALLADRDPFFLEAAFRNTMLLNSCTTNGILFGGPDYAYHGIKPSLHHTFCHAKALTAILDGTIKEHTRPVQELPCEKEYGVKYFEDVATILVSLGPWRGTITAYDFPYYYKPGHATGGALSLLWHRRIGPLVAASMTVYRPIERFDMQKQEGKGFDTLTPRILLGIQPSKIQIVKDVIKQRTTEDLWYTNIMDFSAKVNIDRGARFEVVKSNGYLVNQKTEHPVTGKVSFEIVYQFTDTEFALHVSVKNAPEGATLSYVLPIISRQAEHVKQDTDRRLLIRKTGHTIAVSSDQNMKIDGDTRIFNYVPGFEALPVKIAFKDKLSIHISVL
ncbi:MAG TPA: hypothetical protein DCR95_02520 [Desulfobacter sp.]|nr:hypothetical protein [Desulfobacter sp.]